MGQRGSRRVLPKLWKYALNPPLWFALPLLISGPCWPLLACRLNNPHSTSQRPALIRWQLDEDLSVRRTWIDGEVEARNIAPLACSRARSATGQRKVRRATRMGSPFTRDASSGRRAWIFTSWKRIEIAAGPPASNRFSAVEITAPSTWRPDQNGRDRAAILRANIDAGEQRDRLGRVHRVGEGQHQRHGDRGGDAGQRATENAPARPMIERGSAASR
jgi:hypothetical protein